MTDSGPSSTAAKNAARKDLIAALRKNALFYKNEHGASVGAILLSLIETCRLNEVSAWAYLLWLMRHRAGVRANPSASLPWTYARGEPSAAVEAVARAA